MLFFHALLFFLLGTLVIASPVGGIQSDRSPDSGAEAGPPPKKARLKPTGRVVVVDPNYKPHSRPLHIPELAEAGIGNYNGTYYRDSTGKDDNDVIEIHPDGNIFPYSLPTSGAGNPLEPHSFPEDNARDSERLAGTWLLMPCVLNKITRRNEYLVFDFTKDRKHLAFDSTKDRKLVFQSIRQWDLTVPLAGLMPNQHTDLNHDSDGPPSQCDGTWYREPTEVHKKKYANDIAIIVNKPRTRVSIFKMSTQAGKIDSDGPGALKLTTSRMGRLVGRWRRMPYGSLDTEKRNQIMLVTWHTTIEGNAKLHYSVQEVAVEVGIGTSGDGAVIGFHRDNNERSRIATGLPM